MLQVLRLRRAMQSCSLCRRTCRLLRSAPAASCTWKSFQGLNLNAARTGRQPLRRPQRSPILRDRRGYDRSGVRLRLFCAEGRRRRNPRHSAVLYQRSGSACGHEPRDHENGFRSSPLSAALPENADLDARVCRRRRASRRERRRIPPPRREKSGRGHIEKGTTSEVQNACLQGISACGSPGALLSAAKRFYADPEHADDAAQTGFRELRRLPPHTQPEHALAIAPEVQGMGRAGVS